jgi:hypothetical protein
MVSLAHSVVWFIIVKDLAIRSDFIYMIQVKLHKAMLWRRACEAFGMSSNMGEPEFLDVT